MKLRYTNQIELSVANLRALLAEAERKQAKGQTVNTLIYKVIDGETVAVSVVSDEEHYTESELSQRKSRGVL